MTTKLITVLNTSSQAIIAACLTLIVVIEYVRPWVADLYYRDKYRRLTLDCDIAMHDEAALRSGGQDSSSNPSLAVSAEIGLAVCHEYDKLRKRLLILGVTEETLALRGLEVLENERIPVSRMVEPHRMERF